MRRRSNKPCGAEPSVHGRIHSVFRKGTPTRLPAPRPELEPEMGVDRGISTPARTNSVFEKEVRAGRGYGLGTGFLPGGDHYVGYPVALAGQAAFSVGFAVEAGAQVV